MQGVVKEMGLIPESGRSPGEGHGKPLRHSCLENPTDRGAWRATVPAAAKLLQSCRTLCKPIDGSPPGSLVPGILQARTLEWVAISLSNAWKWKVKVKSLSHLRHLVTPWTAAHQAPLSVGFSRQEYWSGVPLPFGQDWNDIACMHACFMSTVGFGGCYTSASDQICIQF